ncbi:hypothetical protein [Burkholderia sp. MSMB1498]|uniref:hypothetical protein n=1 Tax=Burkholderia sp. MSMB1498 TaxID=1637842 RepID=UPI000A909AAF|nr:hypothetical protein [Burkholderia sp. MSMB1498]
MAEAQTFNVERSSSVTRRFDARRSHASRVHAGAQAGCARRCRNRIGHRASSVGHRTSDVGVGGDGHDMRSNVGSHRCCTRADSGYGIGRRVHTCRLRRCVCSAGVDGVAIGVAIVMGAGLEFDRLAAVTRLAVANAARDATPRRPDHALLDTGRTHAPRRRATPTT